MQLSLACSSIIRNSLQWKIMGWAQKRLEWQMPLQLCLIIAGAINYNPAGLTSLTTFQCSAFIVPDQFGLQELQTTALAAASLFHLHNWN